MDNPRPMGEVMELGIWERKLMAANESIRETKKENDENGTKTESYTFQTTRRRSGRPMIYQLPRTTGITLADCGGARTHHIYSDGTCTINKGDIREYSTSSMQGRGGVNTTPTGEISGIDVWILQHGISLPLKQYQSLLLAEYLEASPW